MVKAVPRTLSAPIGTKNGHNPSSKLRGEPSVKSRAKGSSTAVKSTVRATAKKLAVPEVVAPKSIALPVKSGSTARPSAKKISSKTSKSPTTSQANYDIVTNTTNRVRKAGEVVAERFRKEIAQGILAIGHQLPSEEELTASFGIARTTLREALRVLESQGLLEIKRGRGGGGIITMPRLDNLSQSLALVLQLQRTSLGDLDDARMMIEPPLAGRLATHHSDEDLEVLAGIVEHAHRASEANDRNDFGKAAAALHEEIIARGGNNNSGGEQTVVTRLNLRASLAKS